MAEEINSYTRQHHLNTEGEYDASSHKFQKMVSSKLNQAEKNDNISHFICRLAYCRTDDLRKWFAT